MKKFNDYLEKSEVVVESKSERYVAVGFFKHMDQSNMKKFKSMLEDLIKNYGKILSNGTTVSNSVV